jgi:hypothetical protein
VKTVEIQAYNSLLMDWDVALDADIVFATRADRKQREQNRNISSLYVQTVIVKIFSFFLMEQVYAHNADGNLNGANDFSDKIGLLPLVSQKKET